MHKNSDDNPQLSYEQVGFDILQDIERTTNETIKNRRQSERIVLKTKVILQPGNSSELLTQKIQGITKDISTYGCGAMFPIPLMVGDTYRLSFESEPLALPLVFARCSRCQLIKEDVYEAGFAFFARIQLPEI